MTNGVFRWLTLITGLVLASCGTPTASLSAIDGAHSDYHSVASESYTLNSDSIKVLVGGPAAFTAIKSVIAHAKDSIHVEMYEFSRPDLMNDLISAHKRGVVVTVIGDPSVDVTVSALNTLTTNGIMTLRYPVRGQMIDHVKLLVADGKTAIVGGINWGTHSIYNHDFDAELIGPAVTNLDNIFVRDEITCGKILTAPPSVSDSAIQVVATLPYTQIHPLALSLIEHARTSIDLQLYVLTDKEIVQALVDAQNRGVKIRLLLDPSQTSSNASANQLRRAEVPVKLYSSNGELLHAKVIVTDGANVLFGSANWSKSGFNNNHEVDIQILSSPQVASSFWPAINADWNSAHD